MLSIKSGSTGNHTRAKFPVSETVCIQCEKDAFTANFNSGEPASFFRTDVSHAAGPEPTRWRMHPGETVKRPDFTQSRHLGHMMQKTS